jgi:general secretion pathway protein E
VALSAESRAFLSPQPPAIRAVEELHESAVAARASDIHLEPAFGGGRVRLRVDGMLHEVRRFVPELFTLVVSRIKLLAAMDIADRRQPQDGRYRFDAMGRSIDARVSSMPTIDGEKLVVRLLDMHARVPLLEELGMSPAVLAQYRRLVHAPHGFIVVSGPTGSGKTTTLYASLNERNVESQHLCTIEDPVEIRMRGVAQVQVNTRAGLTFAGALRSFLRQDPNVIMVGEIRDPETAGIAMSAALSGQLVLASLHASDACRTVERLVELGLHRQAIAAGLSGVLAQRLVRRLCTGCRLPAKGERGCVPQGCEECSGAGYCGRTGVFELMSVEGDLSSLIISGASSTRLADVARAGTYRPMVDDCAAAVASGTTSAEEVQRVLHIGAAL